MGERFLELRSVERRFPGGGGLVGADLTLERGELLALIGPSGSGKSTLLRVVAGLDRADRGEILLGGCPSGSLGPVERGVGMTLDDAALYDHLSVRENLRAGLDRFGLRGTAAERAMHEAAELVGALALLDRMPASLSAGERRRASLARAVARKPRLLLLDEPLAHLDERTRLDLREDIRLLHEATGAATLLVTHDHQDALAIADRMAYLDAGRIVQTGSADAFREPAHIAVARGCGWLGFEVCRSASLRLPHPPPGEWVAIAPESVARIADAPGAGDAVALAGIVRYRTTAHRTEPTRADSSAERVVLTVELGSGERIRLPVPIKDAPPIGAALAAELRPATLRWFDATGKRVPTGGA